MLTKDAFIEFILNPTAVLNTDGTLDEEALPEGIEGFGAETDHSAAHTGASFARRLLEASAFGYPELVQRENVIRGGDDTVARYLPEQVCYWPKTPVRPYQTLLFETNVDHKELLSIPAFKGRMMDHLDIVEDALARFVSAALEGFQRGGEAVTSDVRKGTKKETLCVVSIVDKREGQPVHLVCFGTQNEKTGGLETFQITEQTKFWDQQLAREHLALLYERQFKKLESKDWQEAFTTTEERKQADRLLEICTQKAPKEHDLQEGVLDLLDIIAKGFGLRKKPNAERRLVAFALPPDHDIGIDPEELETGFGGQNPFGGITLRDERSRLLGYIIYPLKTKADAARLRKHLKENNRFHNVLLVYPDEEQASLELWQGKEQLVGKLRKGKGYKDAADVVNLLSRFFVVSKANVKNPRELAEELAYRARYLRRLALKQLREESESGALQSLYRGFKESLVHDQTEEEFADAFAQTLTYSLLTARWVSSIHGVPPSDRFTRKAAMQKLSFGSRFLSEMFSAALSVHLDDQRARLLWLIDDIADLLDRIDIGAIFSQDKSDLGADPIIHFYEPFLTEYDATVRMQRGVFYTPRPVVTYIVRAIDNILRSEFLLEDGLADTATWLDMSKRYKDLEIPKGVNENAPFVQILDPATGTGTFLVEVIDLIHQRLLGKWKTQGSDSQRIRSLWNQYVSEHLLPRLHGYELLMAPYAIAHLKIGLKLHETGYRSDNEKQARIFLTNSLEPAHDFTSKLQFTIPALAHEAQAVNEIKRNARFTVVLGNPPYAGHSSNSSKDEQGRLNFIGRLMEDYKEGCPELHKPAQAKWLQDDYVKFIRLSQWTITESKIGVLGFITNHSYLDNPTFRGMRRSLNETFSTNYILDLHGSSKKKERNPSGSVEENVFDIQQGVAIIIASSGPEKCHNSPVHHKDLWGTRIEKYRWLAAHNVNESSWAQFLPHDPLYLLVPQDEQLRLEYEQFPKVSDIFSLNGDPAPGIVTTQDEFAIAFSRAEIISNVEALLATRSEVEARELFQFCTQNQWNYESAIRELRDGQWRQQVQPILYRPFDFRWTVYNRYVAVHRRERVMRHMLDGQNLGMITTRQTRDEWGVLVTRSLCGHKSCSAYDINSLFPLYLATEQLNFGQPQVGTISERRPNLSPTFCQDLADNLNLSQRSPGNLPEEISAEDVFHYAYAVFYSPCYRSRYAEFLKKDFARLPLPTSTKMFRDLVRLGYELVSLHLLESTRLNEVAAEYTGPENPLVEQIKWSDETIWINTSKKKSGIGSGAHFAKVSSPVWNFHFGGFQVCEKWLKDRKGRRLSAADIEHYQKIVTAITETMRLMGEIDHTLEQYGGCPQAFLRELAGVKNA